MSNNLSAPSYQKTKKFLKRIVKGVKIFLKLEKTNSENMVANNIKYFVSMRSKG